MSCNEVLSWEFWDGNLVNLLSLLQGSLSKRDWNTEVLWYSFASQSRIAWYISVMEAWCLVHWVQDTSTSLCDKVWCHNRQSFASEEMPCIACTPSPLFCHGGSTWQGGCYCGEFQWKGAIDAVQKPRWFPCLFNLVSRYSCGIQILITWFFLNKRYLL